MSDALTASTAPPEGSFLATGRGRVTLALLCLVTFLDVMDGANREHSAAAHPYASGFLAAEPAVGGQRLSDYLWRVPALGWSCRGPAGRRRLLVTGTVLFATCSLACGLADSQGLLVGARLAQGFGAAMMTPAAAGHLDHHLPGFRSAQGAGPVGRDQRDGDGGRVDHRRAAHHGFRLAVGVLRDPPNSCAGSVRGVPDPGGRPRPILAGRFRRGRRCAGHRQHGVADVHVGRGAVRGLGCGPYDRRAGRLGGADGRVRAQ